MSTHICIVSDRLMANLIPVLVLRPGRVVLVSSARMEEGGQTARLRRLLEAQGVVVSVHGGLPSGGLGLIREYARALLGSLDDHGGVREAVLNLTGGNKLMAIGFMEVMGPKVGRVIYTDTANGLLEELPLPGVAGDGIAHGGRSRPLAGVVDVGLYLEAQGLQVTETVSQGPEWAQAVAGRRALTRFLGAEAVRLGDVLGALNALASAALGPGGRELVAPEQHFRTVPHGRWGSAVREVARAGLLAWRGGTGVRFGSAEAARYLNGGWLEEYAWLAAESLGPDDLRLGVTGVWEGTARGRNELDLVVVHANRLLLVECKTLRLGRDLADDRDLLYKLDSVGDDVRGLFGEVVLLSARDPGPLILDRAAHHGIQVMGPARLPRLQLAIRDWMAGGRFPAD